MIEDISNEILSRFALYLRIEPRCRRDDFQQGIEARTADPLWYLTRQWQLGEFQGEDNGSPIRIEVDYHNQLINEIKFGEDPTIELPISPPLETIIEQEAVVMNWRLRIRIGQQFERFARQILEEQANAVIVTFRKQGFYPVEALVPDSNEFIYTDRATRRYLNLMAGRAINGEALLNDIMTGNVTPLPNELNIDNALLTQVFDMLEQWYRKLYAQPQPDDKNKAWTPHLTNYQFGLTAADSDAIQTSTISVPDYRNGELDWYSCKLRSSDEVPEDLPVQTRMFNPTRVEFAGKPNERWWAFEDNAVDFAKMDVSTTDLVRTMLMEYAFIYADDWFLIPLAVPVGSLTRIRRLRVNNVFGDDDIIRYATESSSDPLAVWDMYKLSGDSLPVIDTDPLQFASQLLMVPPAINHREESAPIEEVRFIRDEGANLVFAIEHTVSNQIGTPVEGYELQLEKYAREREYLIDMFEGLIADLQAELDDSPTPARREEIETLISQHQKNIEFLENPNQPTDVRGLPQYRLASTVPDNWIPYVPVNASASPIPLASEMSIRLRQAQMLRNVDRMPIITGDPGIDLAAEDLFEVKSIEPLSRLLKGIREEEKLEWLNEEAILRSGLKIQITKQRVRWFDGKTYVWLGRKVLTGRGEGSSGLEFDTFRENL